MDIKYSHKIFKTSKLFIVLILYSFFTQLNLFAEEQSRVLDSSSILENTLPSIVIIDSQRISYNSPYKNNLLKDFFYPLDIDIYASSLQGNGIEHKNIFGSGVIFNKDQDTYFVISNSHVIEDSSSIWITTHDGFIHEARLIGSDQVRDIALVSFKSKEVYPSIPIGNYKNLKIGTKVYAIGVPFGFTYTVTEGIISSLDKTDSTLKNLFIQTDASMNPGNSGGALIDSSGELIGINTWIYSPKGSSSIGINFASSVNIAMDVVNKIMNGETISYAWIGIVYDVFSPNELATMDYTYRLGAIISNIVIDSPAYKSKLEIGDMIIAVNSNQIQSFNANLSNASAIINTLDIDTPATFRVLRNKTILDIEITPEEMPELESKSAMTEFSKKLWPGLSVLPLEDYKKELLGLNNTEGTILYVNELIPNTLAEKSQIKIKDVIIKINNEPITSYRDYLNIINTSINENKDITFTVFDKGHMTEKTLILN